MAFLATDSWYSKTTNEHWKKVWKTHLDVVTATNLVQNYPKPLCCFLGLWISTNETTNHGNKWIWILERASFTWQELLVDIQFNWNLFDLWLRPLDLLAVFITSKSSKNLHSLPIKENFKVEVSVKAQRFVAFEKKSCEMIGYNLSWSCKRLKPVLVCSRYFRGIGESTRLRTIK